MVFTRRFGPPRLEGLRVDSLESLLCGVSELGAPPGILCADLSLGAWQSHQVATELASQLGLALPGPDTDVFEPRQRAFERWVREGFPEDLLVELLLTSADSIGSWIDTESLGNRGRRGSLELARRILGALESAGPRTLAVFAPRFGLAWEPEDVLLVELIAGGLDPQSRIVIVGAERCAIPAGWLVRWRSTRSTPRAEPASPSLQDLVPGLLDEEVCQRLPNGPVEPLLPLPGARFLVGPERRRAPDQVSRLDYDRLAAAVRGRGWLSAYAQYHGNSIHVEPWTLCREAMQRLEEGGEGIALRLQERAASCMTHFVPRGLLQCIAQGWRIALQRYGEVTAVADPSPALPSILRGALLQTKAWGLAMLGQATQAEPYMREALELLRPHFEGRREYLYLKNIAALNQVNLGDLEGALAAEREIEAGVAALPFRDARLEYVNSINLARLHRRLGKLEVAHDYYQRAFATTWGLRTDNDLIYANVCQARLEAARGRHSDALLAWLRAAFHWAAADVPEAIGWRVLMAVLGRRPHDGEDVTEAMSAALVALLLEELKAVRPGMQGMPESAGEGWVFVRPGERGSPAFQRIVGGCGWSVVRAEGDALPAIDGPASRRLRQLLGGLVRSRERDGEASVPGLVVVDDRLGREMATTPVEVLETAVRLAIPRVRYESVSLEVPQALRQALERGLCVSPSRSLDRILRRGREAVATFRRYLRPRALSEDEARLLAFVDHETTIEVLWRQVGSREPFSRFLEAVRALESGRLVEIRLSEQVCLEHGLLPILQQAHR